ncbi:MAG: glycosyltransferase [Enterocloster clostridioformis]
MLKKYADRDRRVRDEILGSNRGISGNTNAALDMARGDFVILADHDDTLPPNAFMRW